MIISRRSFLLAGAATVAAGALGGESVAAPSSPIAAPVYRVGDRWTYRAQDGFRTPVVWEEKHEVIAVASDGIRVRVSQKGPTVDNVREELWPEPGLVSVGSVFDAETRRFKGALQRFVFPLEPGKSWNQRIGNYNEELKRDGEITRWVRVGDMSAVQTPAGTFQAIRMRISMRLDDKEFWRTETECSYLTWYAPAVRNVVRDKREAHYIDGKGRDSATVRSQHAVLELIAYDPAVA